MGCGNGVIDCGNGVSECGNDVRECGNDVRECGNDVGGYGGEGRGIFGEEASWRAKGNGVVARPPSDGEDSTILDGVRRLSLCREGVRWISNGR